MSEIEELQEKVRELEGEVRQVKIISQRQGRESKSYGALNLGAIEELREENDGHFREIHSRLDQTDEKLDLILSLMRGGIRKVEPPEGYPKDNEQP